MSAKIFSVPKFIMYDIWSKINSHAEQQESSANQKSRFRNDKELANKDIIIITVFFTLMEVTEILNTSNRNMKDIKRLKSNL